MTEAEATMYESMRVHSEFMAMNRSGSVGWTAPAPADYSKADISLCVEDVRAYVETIREGGHGDLMIVGKAGRGKTFSSLSVLKSVEDCVSVRFVTEVEALGDVWQAKTDFNDGRSYETAMAAYTLPRVLVLDDVGKSKYTALNVQILKDLMDRRHDDRKGKLTIITTQYDSKSLREKICRDGGTIQDAEAIISRLEAYGTVRLEGQDRRRR